MSGQGRTTTNKAGRTTTTICCWPGFVRSCRALSAPTPLRRRDSRRVVPATTPNVDNRWRARGVHQTALPMPVHLEFTLDYLIRRIDAAVSPAGRRLEDFERTIARLARSWRPDRPISPARELRMA